jgi:hypothetical protein
VNPSALTGQFAVQKEADDSFINPEYNYRLADSDVLAPIHVAIL